MLVWDTLFSEESIVDNANTVRTVAGSMDEKCESLIVNSVARWNTVLGGSVSRAGFTSGLRYNISIDGKSPDEVNDIGSKLQEYKHELVAQTNVRIAENLDVPLRIGVKNRFPTVGRIALSVTFTNGLGYEELKAIQNAKKNQTVDTKNGLNITWQHPKGSGKRFSDEFHSMLDNSDWFTVSNSYGVPTTEVLKGADGGMYESTFDISRCVEELVTISEDSWWQALDSNNVTMTPMLTVDYSSILDSEFDPANWLHLKKGGDVSNSIKAEEKQTGDSEEIEDIEYMAGRIAKGSRPPKQLTSAQGLVSGLEKGLISKHIIRPWIATELVNCLKYYLMTRLPNFWRNNKSEIWLFHEFNAESLNILED